MKTRTELRTQAGSAVVSAQKPVHRANSARARARFKALFGYLCRHRKYVMVATVILVPGGFMYPAAVWLHSRFRRTAESALS